jgi:hypothetical protein
MTRVVSRTGEVTASGKTPAEQQHEEAFPLGRLARRPRNVLLLFVFGVLLVVGIFLLFGKLAGYAETLDQLERAEPIWLAVCFASQVLSYAAYVILVRALTAYADGPRLPPWLATRVVLVALGVTRVLAVGRAAMRSPASSPSTRFCTRPSAPPRSSPARRSSRSSGATCRSRWHFRG